MAVEFHASAWDQHAPLPAKLPRATRVSISPALKGSGVNGDTRRLARLVASFALPLTRPFAFLARRHARMNSTRERHAYAPLPLLSKFFNGSWNVCKVWFRAGAASAGRTDDANDPKPTLMTLAGCAMARIPAG